MVSKPDSTIVVTIVLTQIHTDPSHKFYGVVCQNQGGVWPEYFGSESELHAFLRGIEAGCTLSHNTVTGTREILTQVTKSYSALPAL